MTKRIITYLQGGLGNQCFIYAASRALAIRTGAELSLNVDPFLDDHVYHRVFELEHYNITGHIEPTHNKAFRLYRKIRYHLMARAKCNRLGNLCCDHYPYTYLPLPEEWNGTLMLDGFWQSEHYYYGQRFDLLKDFQLKDKSALKDDEIAMRISQSACPVFVHMRSYKEVPKGKGAEPVTPAFYQAALTALRSKLNLAPELYLFSDDLEWAQERLKDLPVAQGMPVIPVTPSEKCPLPGQIRDFELLRMCHHGIVANSSFSRFAAWLGEQQNVLDGRCPIYIHNSKKKNGYCPGRWLRIDKE